MSEAVFPRSVTDVSLSLFCGPLNKPRLPVLPARLACFPARLLADTPVLTARGILIVIKTTITKIAITLYYYIRLTNLCEGQSIEPLNIQPVQ